MILLSPQATPGRWVRANPDAARVRSKRLLSAIRMARDPIDMTPLQSRDELVAWLEAGVKPVSEFRIGTEHEKTPFTAEGHLPVPYEGGRGIGALLEGMKLLLGWEPIMERGNIIGLYDVTGGGAISLEPGGQFNCRARRRDMHQTQSELMAHLAQVREIAAPLGILLSRAWHDAIVVAGADSGDAERPLQDHDRLHAEGRPIRPRHDVPDLHGASQSRLLARKPTWSGSSGCRWRCSRWRPLLFANSPFTEGKPNGFLSFRSEIWRDTDNARSGIIPSGVRGRHGVRALGRLCARRADVFRQARRYLYRRRRIVVPRFLRRQEFRRFPASARRCRTGPIICRRSSPRCG